MASQSFQTLFRAVFFFSATRARAALYYVNDKVGKLEVEFGCNLNCQSSGALRKPR